MPHVPQFIFPESDIFETKRLKGVEKGRRKSHRGQGCQGDGGGVHAIVELGGGV